MEANMFKKILVVDDEVELNKVICDFLANEGFQPVPAYTGQEALSLFEREMPELILLDIMLPDYDGMEFCRLIRSQSDIPIIMVSAKANEVDKILALGLGADDYVSKPIGLGELLARVKAQLRRYSSTKKDNECMEFNGLKLFPKAYTAMVDGNTISFSGKEFEILMLLVRNKGQVFTKEQIYNLIWGYEEYGDINTVTVHIRKIRSKIEAYKQDANYIVTVWGVGYKFEAN